MCAPRSPWRRKANWPACGPTISRRRWSARWSRGPGFRPGDIEDLLLGCAFPEGEQGLNIARLVSLMAGLPKSLGGGDGQPLLRLVDDGRAHRRRRHQDGCGRGVHLRRRREHEPRADDGLQPAAASGLRRRHARRLYRHGRHRRERRAPNGRSRAPSRRNSRFARKSARPRPANRANINDEIVPIKGRKGVIAQDGCIRPETTLETLAGLKPAFDERWRRDRGHLLAADRRRRRRCWSARRITRSAHDLDMLAAIKSIAVCRLRPEIMGIGPVGATRRRWSAPASRSASSTSSSSTRPSLRRRSPASAISKLDRWIRSISTAAPSRSAIRSAPPARASSARRRRS